MPDTDTLAVDLVTDGTQVPTVLFRLRPTLRAAHGFDFLPELFHTLRVVRIVLVFLGQDLTYAPRVSSPAALIEELATRLAWTNRAFTDRAT